MQPLLLGQTLLQNSFELRVFAGIVIIIFSLQILGLINLNFLNYEKRIQTNNNKNFYSPIIIGMAFPHLAGHPVLDPYWALSWF